jgi:trimeric autotransporter adhesin
MRTALVGLAIGCASACIGQESLRVSEFSVTSEQSIQGTNTVEGDGFGESLAISADGSTIAVGASHQQFQPGTVYIFVRANGQWLQEALLTPADPSVRGFGSAVALSRDGSMVAVGAASAGSVYVFSKTHAGWNQQAEIIGGTVNFGWQVVLSGDGTTLAAGSPNFNVDSGAVYIYRRSGMRWNLRQQLTGNNQFGHSLAMSDDGNTLAVGSFANFVGIYNERHKVWEQSAYVRPNISDPDDGFGGWSVSMTSDATRLAVGAPYEASNATGINGDATDNSMPYAGAAYLFFEGSTQTEYIKPSNPDSYDEFGFSVALSSTNLVVGAIGEASGFANDPGDNSSPVAGAAYVFSIGTVAQTDYLKAPAPTPYKQYGRTVATSADGSVIAVGQPYLNGGVVITYSP